MRKITLASHARAFATSLTIILSMSVCTGVSASETLDVYFIDVEGGQASLIVMPNGETMLVDAGYPGQGKTDPTPGDPASARDAQRIAAAATDAGVSRIDYMLVSHFHRDHFGGVMELSQLLPITTIIDHGTEVEKARSKPNALKLIQAYETTREQHDYIRPSVGEPLPVAGAEIVVVSSAGTVLEKPLDGAGEKNTPCSEPVQTSGELSENARSTGILIQHGEFRFLNLADLVDQPLSGLVCPTNRIGAVDVYLVAHHGLADAADPATLAAFRPRVAILNNGATKGGAPVMFDVLRSAEGLEDVWQLHLSKNEGAENFPDERIANLDTQTANWIKLSARTDGSFRILNGRTGQWTAYEAR